MNYAALDKKLRENNSFTIYGHMNPDGDSIGAMLAMTHILETHYGKKEIRMQVRDDVPTFLQFLPKSDRIRNYDENSPVKKTDLTILVDCGSPKRIGDELAPYVENAESVVVVDHHVTNAGYGDLNLTDPDASSTCEIICRFIKEMNIRMDETLAIYLYTGIMYDTGRFMHSNTTPEVFDHCASLVSLGVRPSDIALNVYSRRSFSHLKLLGYVLSNFITVEDGAIAYITMSRAAFEELGAGDEDNEGVVEEIGKYAECEVHASFLELPDGRIRVSMRSKGNIIVGRICRKFGGGGHDLAAGIRIKDTLNAVVEKVIEETSAELKKWREREVAGD